MSKNLIVLVISILLCTVIVIGMSIVVVDNFISGVSINIIQEIPSPNETFKLIKYTKDINITVEKSYNMTIVKNSPSNEIIDSAQFVCDEDFDVTWCSDDEIILYVDKNATIYKNTSSVKVGGKNILINIKEKSLVGDV